MAVIDVFQRVARRFSKARRSKWASRRISVVDKSGLLPKIRERHLTYLSSEKLLKIISLLKNLEREGVEGQLVEAGCALGGSLVVISGYSSGRAIRVYDTFEMIPPPTEHDPPEVHDRYETIVSGKSKGIGGDIYYGYRGDLEDFVRKQVKDLVGQEQLDRIDFNKGLLQDTMQLSTPVAFAHIDVDWYDPVKTCIERLWPLLSIGGVLVFDDYFDWGGCQKAVDEYFDGRSDCSFDDSAGNMVVSKKFVPV